MSLSNRTSDQEGIIRNSRTNTLYSHDFGNGRFFSVIHEDESGFDVKLAPRTMLKVVYLPEKRNIEGLHIVKLISNRETQKLDLSKFDFQQLRAFLEFVSTQDLDAIPERRMSLANDDDLSSEVREQIRKLLSKDGGEELIKSLLDEGIVTSFDVVNTGYRKRQLDIFETLLSQPGHWKTYAAAEGISTYSEEKVWQHFFCNNDWIFGYGLDYRFQGILQKEFHASQVQADGSEGVITDFLLGDSKFTTFVEIKKPSTEIFGKEKNRSNSWRLSNDLVDGVSQILEHKASGEHRFEAGNLFDSKGNKIEQKAYDAKVILVIGSWDQMIYKNPLERQIKEKTFELYRRDSRNIKMLTYDELLERARFIVQHKSNSPEIIPVADDDVPF